jgi:hypothetical protein
MNIDVEIYLTQVYSFFNSNPNELKKLIGDLSKETFFNKIKETAYQNFEKSGDMVLSKNQLILITVELFENEKISKCVQQTKFGNICLN